MARIKTRIDVIDRDIKVLFGDDIFEPQARSKYLAQEARKALAEGQAQNKAVMGRVPPHDTYVDGRSSVNLESVKPDGQIIFEFELVFDVFEYIREQLILHSPVGRDSDPRPGHPELYARSHMLIADGREVPEDAVPPPAEEYAFVNTQPYARKIERGLSAQAPDGVYQVVATLAQQKFGNVARIRFSYRTPIVGAVNAWAETTRLVMRKRRKNRSEWLRRQPAIVVTLR